MRSANLSVRSLTGKQPKNCGKVVQYKGTMIFHQYAQNAWKRQTTDSWGLNTAVVDYLYKNGIVDIFLYVASEDCTYSTYTGMLRDFGVPSSRHDYGENINLPVEEWSRLPGKMKVAWVHKDTVVMLQPKPLEAPPVEPEKEPEHDTAQLGLFA